MQKSFATGLAKHRKNTAKFWNDQFKNEYLNYFLEQISKYFHRNLCL
jgi:hypothetical protein